MKKEKTYKTPIKASRLIEALSSIEEEDIEIFDDEACYPTIGSARLSYAPGEACGVEYTILSSEDDAMYGLSAGYYRFCCLGVIYEGSRGFDSSDDWEDESLSGREIKYDIDPYTGEEYTEDDVLEAIHDEVMFPTYDADNYPIQWNASDLERVREYLEYECYDDEEEYEEDDEDDEEENDDEDGDEEGEVHARKAGYFALGENGIVYYYNANNPPPRGMKVTKISREEAIDIIVNNQQYFDRSY